MQVRLVPRSKVWREQCCGSAALALACLLQLQWPWSFGLCSFLNANPRSNANPRWTIKSHVWVETVAKEKSKDGAMLGQPCAGLDIALADEVSPPI